MATVSCHSNQNSYPIEIKKCHYSLPQPIDAIRIGFMASEKMLFEDADRQTMSDAWLYYKLTYKPLAQAS